MIKPATFLRAFYGHGWGEYLIYERRKDFTSKELFCTDSYYMVRMWMALNGLTPKFFNRVHGANDYIFKLMP